MKKSTFLIILFFNLFYLSSVISINPKVLVDVNVDVKHIVGNNSEFERNKYLTIHSDQSESEWGNVGGSINKISNYRDNFLNGYDAYMGRNTGPITYTLNNQITQDTSRPGFGSPTSITTVGNSTKNSYSTATAWHPYEKRNELVICTQQFPFWPDGQKTNLGWSFSQTDTESEPFGTASGEFYGRYIQATFGMGTTTGQPKPKWVEVINEPDWPLYDWVTTGHSKQTFDKISRFHSTVAKQVKLYNPGIKVGGYVAAFPNFEVNDANNQTTIPDFDRWEKRDKTFIDVAGADMDFISIHLYDFPCWNNRQQYRKGSNVEATLDMLEQYTYMKFGAPKPIVISEFGASSHQATKTWSPYRDWLHIKSANSLMMQFMQRPSIIEKTINFTMLKWSWEASTASTYQHRLFRKENEPASYTGDWVYTDQIKFFELWKNVKGTRVDTRSNCIDILTDSYIDGEKVYVAINNLNLNQTYSIQSSLLGTTKTISQLKVKKLYLNNNLITYGYATPVLEEEIYDSNQIPTSFNLAPEGTMILEYSYSENIDINQTEIENKYYTTTYKQAINANQEVSFLFNNIDKSATFGEAVLRLGVGRAFGLSLQPVVSINGTHVPVNAKSYRGDDQYLNGAGRFSFFGVLEIEVPYSLINAGTNTATIKFDDAGGFISTAIMQLYGFSREITRSNNQNTAIPIPNSNELQIVPNYSLKNVLIKIDALDKINTVKIYNISGQSILSETLSNVENYFDISALNTGIYFIQVYSGNKQLTNKIIIN